MRETVHSAVGDVYFDRSSRRMMIGQGPTSYKQVSPPQENPESVTITQKSSPHPMMQLTTWDTIPLLLEKYYVEIRPSNYPREEARSHGQWDCERRQASIEIKERRNRRARTFGGGGVKNLPRTTRNDIFRGGQIWSKMTIFRIFGKKKSIF